MVRLANTRRSWQFVFCLASVIIGSFIFFIAFTAEKSMNEEPIFNQEELEWIQSHPIVKVAPDPDYAPIEFYDNNEFQGITADYFNRVSDLYGIQFQMIHYDTWGDVLKAAEKGEISILSAAVKTPDRSKYLNFTEPYLTMPNQFYIRKGSKPIGNVDQLKGMDVAVIDGYSSEDYLRLVYPEINLIEVVDIEEGLTRLSLGEIDTFVGDSGQVAYYTEFYQINNIVYDGSIRFDFPLKLAIAVDKDDLVLLSIMNKVVKNFPSDMLDQIKSKWLNFAIVDAAKEQQMQKVIWGSVLTVISIILFILMWNVTLRRTVNAQTQQLRALIDLIPYPVFAKNSEGVFVIVNQAYADFFGMHVKEIEGKPDAEIYSTNAYVPKERFSVLDNEVLEHERRAHVQSYSLIDSTGKAHIFDIKKIPYPLPNEEKSGILGVSVDITELKMKETERLTALSRLVANVAHQINTPLGNVISSVSFMVYKSEKMKEKTQSGILSQKECDDYLEMVYEANSVIEKSLGRLVEVVEAFKSLSITTESMACVTFSINELIQQVLNQHVETTGIQCTIHFDVEEQVTSYPDIVEKILYQIISNAVEHGFKSKDMTNRKLDFYLHKYTDEMVIEVCDNGAGIPESELKHVLDPLYSSAQYFGHLGLGLSISANMAQQILDGQLEVQNREQGGVSVKIHFKPN